MRYLISQFLADIPQPHIHYWKEETKGQNYLRFLLFLRETARDYMRWQSERLKWIYFEGKDSRRAQKPRQEGKQNQGGLYEEMASF